jgi:CRP/FNR family transcriptional regulator, nitrogen oxide reductase regulator
MTAIMPAHEARHTTAPGVICYYFFTMRKTRRPARKASPAAASGEDLVSFFKLKVNAFANLPAGDLRELAAACSERSYGNGHFFARAGEPTDAIRIVAEGLVQLNRPTRSGGNIAIEVLVPGDALGFAALMDGTWPVNGMTMKPTRLLEIPKETMRRIMDRRPAVSKMVIAHFIERLRYLGTQVFLAREPVEKRLAAALIYLSRKFGTEIPLTCADIGALAGTTPETTIRTFAQLRAAGLIKTARSMVGVINLPALQRKLGLE